MLLSSTHLIMSLRVAFQVKSGDFLSCLLLVIVSFYHAGFPSASLSLFQGSVGLIFPLSGVLSISFCLFQGFCSPHFSSFRGSGNLILPLSGVLSVSFCLFQGFCSPHFPSFRGSGNLIFPLSGVLAASHWCRALQEKQGFPFQEPTPAQNMVIHQLVK